MKRRRKDWGYRHPHTTQERRENQEGWERPRRRPNRLVDFWDDKPVWARKSWKDDRTTQYYTEGRGKHHQLRIGKDECYKLLYHHHNDSLWRLQQYCTDHNIPHRTDEVKGSYLVPEYEWIYTGKIKRMYFKERSYWDIHERVRRPTGRMIPRTYTKYYVFNWWTDKDIGVEYIIR